MTFFTGNKYDGLSPLSVVLRPQKPITIQTNIRKYSIWMFPKIGVPSNHPLLIGFSIINYPFWGTPIFWKHGEDSVPTNCFPHLPTSMVRNPAYLNDWVITIPMTQFSFSLVGTAIAQLLKSTLPGMAAGKVAQDPIFTSHTVDGKKSQGQPPGM